MHVRLAELFTQRFGAPPTATQELRAHGSSRKLYRLHGANGESAVGVEYDEREENAAFVGFTKHFRAAGLPVPEIYGEDLAQGVYLEEDLGDTTLFDVLQKERGQSEEIPAPVAAIYRQAVGQLARMQIVAGKGKKLDALYTQMNRAIADPENPLHTLSGSTVTMSSHYFRQYRRASAGPQAQPVPVTGGSSGSAP